MLLMSLMKRVARNHGFRVLLHEKPFDGINGSGKHNNWSLTASQGEGSTLLHAPGKTPEENLRFVTFIVETLMAVYRHNGLLKASIVSATNAHRLGGNEAPPAIISSFLGKQLTELLDHIELSDKDDLFNLKGKQGMEIDIPQIMRKLPRAIVRCQPSSMCCATTSRPVSRFDGNGYSEAWVKEASSRGLDVEKSCPKIIEHYLDETSIKMFESTKVMNRKELEARNEVKWETYVKTVQIEARVMGDLSMNHIIPVSTHYQSQLIKNVQGMKDVFPEEQANRLSARNMKLIQEIAERTERIEQLVEELTEARRVANRIQSIHERAITYHDTVCPKMDAIRSEIDHLEMIVEDGLWSLPKYRELLFIR